MQTRCAHKCRRDSEKQLLQRYHRRRASTVEEDINKQTRDSSRTRCPLPCYERNVQVPIAAQRRATGKARQMRSGAYLRRRRAKERAVKRLDVQVRANDADLLTAKQRRPGLGSNCRDGEGDRHSQVGCGAIVALPAGVAHTTQAFVAISLKGTVSGALRKRAEQRERQCQCGRGASRCGAGGGRDG